MAYFQLQNSIFGNFSNAKHPWWLPFEHVRRIASEKVQSVARVSDADDPQYYDECVSGTSFTNNSIKKKRGKENLSAVDSEFVKYVKFCVIIIRLISCIKQLLCIK